MKHLKKFNENWNGDIQKIDEGAQEITLSILGLLGAAGSAYGQQQQATTPEQKPSLISRFKDKISKFRGDKEKEKVATTDPDSLAPSGKWGSRDFKKFSTYHTSNKKEAEKRIKAGWTLDKVEMDTVWTQLVKNKPDTIIHTTKLSIDKDAYFASGRFSLNDEVKQSIRDSLDEIVDEGGIIMNIKITSSTDKQGLSAGLQQNLKKLGYTGDNPGLSKARNNSVKDVIVDYGFNGDNIQTVELSERGTGEIDQSARFVEVEIAYAKEEIDVTPGEKSEPQMSTSKEYFLSKPKQSHDISKITKSRTAKPSQHRRGRSSKFIQKRKHVLGRVDGCAKNFIGNPFK